ncbi:NAD-dependent epimerase/dehydratase family protein [Bordetella sp. 2513F-2]
MRVLITGGAGFVGLALAEALLARGDEVVLFDRRTPPEAFLAAMRPHAARLSILQGDVCSDADVAHACRGATHVFHGAAITAGPGREAETPLQVLHVNLGGTVRMLRAAADHGIRRFVYPSSLTVYGAAIEGAGTLDETTPVAPDTLYGITKYAGEATALRLGSLWNIQVVAARIGSVFGPWEGETGVRDMVSPYAQVAARAARGESVVLPGRYPRREMIYAPDLAAGLIALLAAPQPGHQRYNLSANVDWQDAMSAWCAALARHLPGFGWREAAAGEQPNIDYHQATPRAGLDAGRACADLGFTVQFPRDAALDHYAGWVARNRSFFI